MTFQDRHGKPLPDHLRASASAAGTDPVSRREFSGPCNCLRGDQRDGLCDDWIARPPRSRKKRPSRAARCGLACRSWT